MDNNDTVMTIEELSQYIKIPVTSIYKLVQEGKIPGKKIGKHWRFSRDTINSWINDGEKKHE